MKLKRFGSFINENYGKNILNKFNNYNIAYIHGLYRNMQPFKDTNIQQLNNETLNDLFESWKILMLSKLNIDKGLTTYNIVINSFNYYIDNIQLFKQPINNFITLTNLFIKNTNNDILNLLYEIYNENKSIPQGLKNFEQLQDCLFQNNILKPEIIDTKFSITNPDTKDIIYETDTILIVKGSTQQKCIQYGNGYSWCISQMGVNYFKNYRVTENGTIYFVLNKTLQIYQDKRLCVVLVYLNNDSDQITYGIADKTNEREMSGGPETAKISFSYVEKNLPWCKGLKKYFMVNIVTENEESYHEFVSIKYEKDNIIEHINQLSTYLTFNDEVILPKDIFTDYIMANILTNNQFKNILNNKIFLEIYVEIRTKDITYDEYMLLSKNLKNRYTIKIKDINKNDLSFILPETLSSEEIIKIIQDNPFNIFKFSQDFQKTVSKYVPTECNNDIISNIQVISQLDIDILNNLKIINGKVILNNLKTAYKDFLNNVTINGNLSLAVTSVDEDFLSTTIINGSLFLNYLPVVPKGFLDKTIIKKDITMSVKIINNNFLCNRIIEGTLMLSCIEDINNHFLNNTTIMGNLFLPSLNLIEKSSLNNTIIKGKLYANKLNNDDKEILLKNINI
jgi:hypothetical protein